MQNIDFGTMTIPVFAAIFGMGWGSCYLWIAKPLRERVTALEKNYEDLFLKFQKKVLGE